MSYHSNRTNRRLHFIGVTLALLQLLRTIFFSFGLVNLMMVPLLFGIFALSGHYFFEKRFLPLKYGVPGFASDLKMCFEIATGKRAF
jgi:hypothetical protein